jgi:hypothetical protein
VQLQRLFHIGHNVLNRFADGSAAQNIGTVGTIAGRRLADHDQITCHHSRPRFGLFFQACLLEDTLLGFLVEIGIHLAGNSYASTFYGMFVLAVATSGFDSVPAVGLDLLDDLSDFHLAIPCLTVHGGYGKGTGTFIDR